MSVGRASTRRAATIRCIVCGTTLAQVLYQPGWSDHLHAWDDREAAARIIAEDETRDD